MRLRLVLVLLATLALSVPARAAGPELSVPAAELAAALDCPQPLAGATRAPVLLIPGTNLEPKGNFDWNYMPALTDAGIPWCALELPRYGMGDVQVAAEYVVAALRRMYSESGRRVSIVGYSQGGMIGRWALRWWPDTRAMVEDLIGNAPSNHGTLTARPACSSSCAPAYWQQRDDSRFIAALNDGPETFAGIDYTVNFTRYDEVVTPNADAATGSSALRTGDGRIQNTALQDVCPSNTAEHLVIGSYDPVAWALVLDALTNDGPADPARIDPAVCAQPFMPGVDAAAFPQNWARYSATVGEGSQQAEQASAEPELRCYVTDSCPAASHPPRRRKLNPPCVRRSRFELKLPRGWRSVRVRVSDGRVAWIRKRRGRWVARIDLRRAQPGVVTVRARGERASGRVQRVKKRYRVCRPKR